MTGEAIRAPGEVRERAVTTLPVSRARLVLERHLCRFARLVTRALALEAQGSFAVICHRT